ncbi:MAG: DUF892 family protein [Cyclobacteriaceae bacterium]|nr:DUF892 family protein [Cyclobacteriaceae bacterium SS2]
MSNAQIYLSGIKNHNETMKALRNLKELMTEQLRSLYLGDAHLEELLLGFVRETSDPTLRSLFFKYINQTSDQIIILKRVFNDLFEQKRGGDSNVFIAITQEARSQMSLTEGKEIKDALMILYIQYIIHHKIVMFGSICTYGKLMGFYDDISLLHQELEREKKMDRDLAMIAESIVDIKVPQYA